MNRRNFLAAIASIAAGSQIGPQLRAQGEGAGNPTCRVAAYYFGDYHQDPRNILEHGPAWTEWNLVKSASPRFPGHRQPRVPLWGYGDESDPKVFEMKIAAAKAGKIDAFIFDWYWYKMGLSLKQP